MSRPTVPRADLLAVLAGALLTAAFAPFNQFYLAILAPGLLLWLWRGQTPRRAARRGLLFGLGHFGSGVYWVYISLHTYGKAPPAFAALATALLILYMALYPAAVGYLLNRFAARPEPSAWLLVAPALWAGLEWVRSWLFSGFPWLTLGDSQTDSWLGHLAPYLGVFGVSWAALLMAGLVLLVLLHRWRLAWGGLLLALWAGAWALGQITWVEADGKPLRISLIQGNIDQAQKWQPETLERTLELYATLTLKNAKDSDVVIWPETAIPLFFEDLDPKFISALEDLTRSQHIDILTGVPFGNWDKGIFHNGVVAIGAERGAYHKRQLVPFGEYMPLRFLFNLFHNFVDIPMGDFTPGARDQPLIKAGGHPVGVSICFEAAFGSEIRLSLPDARFLVNVSNDAWFGDSLAPHQHLQIARMRAMEAGRPMARATNTGVSALIDARGRIITAGKQFDVEVIKGEIQPLRGATPFARWGDWPIVGFTALALGLGLILTRFDARFL